MVNKMLTPRKKYINRIKKIRSINKFKSNKSPRKTNRKTNRKIRRKIRRKTHKKYMIGGEFSVDQWDRY